MDTNELSSQPGVTLQAVAKKLGFSWGYGYWPGYVRGIGHLANSTTDLAHELGHFLAAPSSRKHIPYFGLGDPATDYSGCRITLKASQQEEELASVLGIELLLHVGVEHQVIRDTLEEHSWMDNIATDFLAVSDRAIELGLVTFRRAQKIKKFYTDFAEEVREYRKRHGLEY